MFEAISPTKNVQNSEKIVNAEPLPASEENIREIKKTESNKHEQGNKRGEISQVFLDELEKDIKLIHNVGLRFSVHEPTGRTIVKVIDKETKEMIREIPAEEILNLAAKLDEMMGMLFDTRV